MLDYERIRLASPCGALIKGRLGTEQPEQVKSMLAELEKAGLAEYRRNRRGWGWHLTARGELEAVWVRREAKRVLTNSAPPL